MKDSLNDLFSERFQGHEVPVDPAVWQVIEARLLTGAPATDEVNELFRERFQQHEVHVDPSVWQGISSQLGHAGAGAGLLGGYGWVAAGLAGVVVAVGAFFVLNSPEEPREVAQIPIASEVVEALPAEQTEADPVILSSETPAEPEPLAVGEQITRRAERPTPKEPALVQTQGPQTDLQELASPSTSELPLPSRPGSEVVKEIITEMSDEVRSAPVTAQPEPGLRPATPNAEQGDEPGAEEPDPGETHAPVEEELFMPNTFTPNGDGVNDEYRVVPNVPFAIMHLRVFSQKTNQLVFSSNSGEAWTGANCEDGWYMVAVEVMTQDGRVLSEGKVVWLSRQGMN